MRLSNFHIVASSFAAIAGVAIAGYQAFAPSPIGQQSPLNVVVALDQPQKGNYDPNVVVEKTDAVPALATEAVELSQDATVTAALKDGSDERYAFTNLFDGRADTYLTIREPDTEVNILLTFRGSSGRPVTAIEYTPPVGIDPSLLATTVDVMILPEGHLEASGRPVLSFTLQQSNESQTFAIPGHTSGKGMWLRIAGAPDAKKSIVGDFRVLSEGVAP